MTSSAGELVFANSLIMAEIYGHLEAKRDMANCLLISKAGFNTAAKRLYREMRSADISCIFESLCGMERLHFVAQSVLVLTIPQSDLERDSLGRMKLYSRCPLRRYPNLEELVIDKNTPNHLLATVTERHDVGERTLIVKHNVDSSSNIDWKHSSLEIRGSSGTVALQQSTLVEALIQDCKGLDGIEADRSRIAGLTELTYTAIGGVDAVKLDAILQHCKHLRRLSVRLTANAGHSVMSAVLRPKRSASLQDLELHGGQLWWLRDLSDYERLTLECPGVLPERWFREQLVQKSSRKGQKLAGRSTIRLDLRLKVISPLQNPYVIAKFVQMCVADETEVTISTSGECKGASRTWLDNLRSTLELLQMESKAERSDE
ncbi:hypothetical protein FFLO_05600 [Filobasidium floriforme]|uniref:Uncharacterized protein n=1 Tax=Filobasidium floriforme TaxID=5210 RepID=A0A8K0NNU1_9TREE|nr:hypothetical protein FFLO_05600 [Filobasidium floriforme]